MTTPAANTDNRSMDRGCVELVTLEKAREIPLHDMNQAELTVVILHDPDLAERRAALRLFKLEIVLEAESRICEALRQVRK